MKRQGLWSLPGDHIGWYYVTPDARTYKRTVLDSASSQFSWDALHLETSLWGSPGHMESPSVGDQLAKSLSWSSSQQPATTTSTQVKKPYKDSSLHPPPSRHLHPTMFLKLPDRSWTRITWLSLVNPWTPRDDNNKIIVIFQVIKFGGDLSHGNW